MKFFVENVKYIICKGDLLMSKGQKNLVNAKKMQKDEFYTPLSAIENELTNYEMEFVDKTIFCNCDSIDSNFTRYFIMYFERLKIKKIICSNYNFGKPSEIVSYDGCEIKKIKIQNTSFDSDELKDIYDEADIVITNPPFSKFKKFVSFLIDLEMDFIILGNINAISYSSVFEKIVDKKIHLGFTKKDIRFVVPDDYESTSSMFKRIDDKNTILVKGVRWFTTFDINNRDYFVPLNSKSTDYFDVFDDMPEIINIDEANKMPINYCELMGVPITFLDKLNSKQFELVGQMASSAKTRTNFGYPFVNGNKKYARIIIRLRKE